MRPDEFSYTIRSIANAKSLKIQAHIMLMNEAIRVLYPNKPSSFAIGFIKNALVESGGLVHVREKHSLKDSRREFPNPWDYFESDAYRLNDQGVEERYKVSYLGHNGNNSVRGPSGDAFLYRGGGPCQITGKNNFTRCIEDAKLLFGFHLSKDVSTWRERDFLIASLAFVKDCETELDVYTCVSFGSPKQSIPNAANSAQRLTISLKQLDLI